MDTQELIKKVRKIEIKTRGLSKQLFSGDYSSAFKGRGMSFSEVREYSYGDDVRNIDWNVTARTGSPHIKVFEEERELTVMLLIDVSKSQSFGTVSAFKKDIVAEISAVLAFSAINNNDKVGAIFFSDKIEAFLPPKKGKKNILRIIREVIQIEPEGTGTSVEKALEYLNNVQKKRSIVFILSDFVSPSFETALSISGRRHDVIGINIFDEREKELPDVGLIRVKDLETNQIAVIDTGNAQQRSIYNEEWQQSQNELKRTLRKYGADQVDIMVEEDYVKALIGFFKKRV
jgi:uncharacterized protein (DUF58 family)